MTTLNITSIEGSLNVLTLESVDPIAASRILAHLGTVICTVTVTSGGFNQFDVVIGRVIHAQLNQVVDAILTVIPDVGPREAVADGVR